MYGQNLRGTALTAVITITAGFGFLLFGYDQGVFSGLLSTQSFMTQFNNPDSMVQGQIVSSYDLGCLFGAVMMLFVGDKLGRKRSIALGCVIVIVGATLQCTSFSLPQLIVARIVTGLGTGANTTVIPLWQSELAQAHNRGKLIGFSLVVVTLGLVVANLINLFMTWAPQDNSVTWRFPLAFQMVFALVTLFMLLFTPESPRWLALRDRFDEANAIMARILDKADDDVLVQQNLQQIIDTVQHERELQKPGMREIFSGGRQQTFRRIVLGASASFMQQVGGTNVIGYYLSILLVDSFGFSSRMALVLSVVDFISFSVWTLLGSFLLDRVGRKTLFLIGALGQGICFAMAAVGLGVGGKAMNGFAVAFIFAFYIFQGTSFCPIPFIYPSEVNSQRMRNTGAAIAIAIQWLFVYVVVLITPHGIANLGWKFYIIFAALNIAFVPFIWYFFVETAGLSLEQIDRLFEVKYEGGASMSYDEARKVVKNEEFQRNSEKGGAEYIENA